MDKQLTEEDLKDIEKEMNKIVKENLPLERKELSREDALKFFQEQGEGYKVELINDLPKDAIISLYSQGEFTDLCAGPHDTGHFLKRYSKTLSHLNHRGGFLFILLLDTRQ